MFWALKLLTLCSAAALASILHNDSLKLWAFANAHAALARSCAFQLSIRSFAALAISMNSCTWLWPDAANAHVVITRLCCVKSLMRDIASCASAANNLAFQSPAVSPAVANAHAVLATSCGVNNRAHCCVPFANARKSFESSYMHIT